MRTDSIANPSRGLFGREPFDGLVERRIAGGRRLTKFNIRLFDGDRGFEAFLVQRSAVRRQVPNRGQPQARAVRQFDELLASEFGWPSG